MPRSSPDVHLHNILGYILHFEEIICNIFKMLNFKKSLKEEVLEAFVKNRIYYQDVTSILNMVHGLSAVNQLEKHIRCWGCYKL